MVDQKPHKFVFVSHQEASGVKLAKINQHIALLAHGKRRDDQTRAEDTGVTSATVDNGVHDTKTHTHKHLGLRTRWRLNHTSPTSQKQRRRRVRRTNNEEEDALMRLSKLGLNTCSQPSLGSWITKTHAEFTINKDNFHALRYLLHCWILSASQGNQMAALGPLFSRHRELSGMVVQGAFDPSSSLSLYAILAAGARRTQMINSRNSTMAPPEIYIAKALNALQKVIASKTLPSVRVVLDLAYLILAEVYMKHPSNLEIYWSMLRDIIIAHGGLLKIPPFTLHSCAGFDALVFATTLTMPALDPYHHPELMFGRSTVALDTESALSKCEREREIFNMIQQLEERPRILITVIHACSDMLEALQKLPDYVQENVRSLITEHKMQVVCMISAPFVPTITASDAEAELSESPASSVRSNADVPAADCEYVHVKGHLFLIWLWAVALANLHTEPKRAEAARYAPCCDVQIRAIVESIERVVHDLQGTGWRLKPEVLVWLLAVAAISDPLDRNLDYTRRMLRSSILATGIMTRHGLDSLLQQMPPLSLLLRGMGKNSVWDLIH